MCEGSSLGGENSNTESHVHDECKVYADRDVRCRQHIACRQFDELEKLYQAQKSRLDVAEEDHLLQCPPSQHMHEPAVLERGARLFDKG